jgi:hypothetical protein
LKYIDLRDWLLKWVNDLPDRPIPLNIDQYTMSRDVRVSIRVTIDRIEAVEVNERNKSKTARADFNHLKSIKAAIDNEQFDISSFGYSEHSNFKNVG